jgi:Na+/H+ antiporter NhaC
VSATVQPVIEKRTPPTGVWWRWAVVLAPGVLLYFFALPGMNTAQERLFVIFTATIIALVAQPARLFQSTLAGWDPFGFYCPNNSVSSGSVSVSFPVLEGSTASGLSA